MAVVDLAALGDGEAGEVHEAGHVSADEDIGIGFENIVQFQSAHAAGNVGEGDREGAAEAAALLGLAEGGDDGILNGFEQGEGGLTAAGAAAVTGAVEGDAGGFLKFSGPFLDAQTIVDEVHHFPSAARERVDGGVRILLELE